MDASIIIDRDYFLHERAHNGQMNARNYFLLLRTFVIA